MAAKLINLHEITFAIFVICCGYNNNNNYTNLSCKKEENGMLDTQRLVWNMLMYFYCHHRLMHFRK